MKNEIEDLFQDLEKVQVTPLGQKLIELSQMINARMLFQATRFYTVTTPEAVKFCLENDPGGNPASFVVSGMICEMSSYTDFVLKAVMAAVEEAGSLAELKSALASGLEVPDLPSGDPLSAIRMMMLSSEVWSKNTILPFDEERVAEQNSTRLVHNLGLCGEHGEESHG